MSTSSSLPKYRLYAPEASFRAFAPLVAAEYGGIGDDVEVVTVGVGGGGDAVAAAAAVLQKSPTGKLPVLECCNSDSDGGGDDDSDSIIFSSNAIARYLAGVRRDANLLGSSLSQQALVDRWVDWCSTALELPAAVWFYPVAGYMPFHKPAYDKAKQDFASALKVLEDHLAAKADKESQRQQQPYLVGNRITLADIVVVSVLLYPFKLVADPEYLKPYPNVVEWFTHCCSQAQFQQVVGNVALCKQELKAPGHNE